MPHVGLVCRLGGVSAAREYFCTRGGGRGRPLGAEWPLKKEITRPEVYSLPVCRRCPESHIELANTVIDNATNGAGEDMR